MNEYNRSNIRFTSHAIIMNPGYGWIGNCTNRSITITNNATRAKPNAYSTTGSDTLLRAKYQVEKDRESLRRLFLEYQNNCGINAAKDVLAEIADKEFNDNPKRKDELVGVIGKGSLTSSTTSSSSPSSFENIRKVLAASPPTAAAVKSTQKPSKTIRSRVESYHPDQDESSSSSSEEEEEMTRSFLPISISSVLAAATVASKTTAMTSKKVTVQERKRETSKTSGTSTIITQTNKSRYMLYRLSLGSVKPIQQHQQRPSFMMNVNDSSSSSCIQKQSNDDSMDTLFIQRENESSKDLSSIILQKENNNSSSSSFARRANDSSFIRKANESNDSDFSISHLLSHFQTFKLKHETQWIEDRRIPAPQSPRPLQHERCKVLDQSHHQQQHLMKQQQEVTNTPVTPVPLKKSKSNSSPSSTSSASSTSSLNLDQSHQQQHLMTHQEVTNAPITPIPLKSKSNSSSSSTSSASSTSSSNLDQSHQQHQMQHQEVTNTPVTQISLRKSKSHSSSSKASSSLTSSSSSSSHQDKVAMPQCLASTTSPGEASSTTTTRSVGEKSSAIKKHFSKLRQVVASIPLSPFSPITPVINNLTTKKLMDIRKRSDVLGTAAAASAASTTATERAANSSNQSSSLMPDNHLILRTTSSSSTCSDPVVMFALSDNSVSTMSLSYLGETDQNNCFAPSTITTTSSGLSRRSSIGSYISTASPGISRRSSIASYVSVNDKTSNPSVASRSSSKKIRLPPSRAILNATMSSIQLMYDQMMLDDTDQSVVSIGTCPSWNTSDNDSYCSTSSSRCTSSIATSRSSMESVLTELLILQTKEEYQQLIDNQTEATIETAVQIIAALHIAKMKEEETNHQMIQYNDDGVSNHNDNDIENNNNRWRRLDLPIQYTSKFIDEYCSYLFPQDDRKVSHDRQRESAVRDIFFNQYYQRSSSLRSLSTHSSV